MRSGEKANKGCVLQFTQYLLLVCITVYAHKFFAEKNRSESKGRRRGSRQRRREGGGEHTFQYKRTEFLETPW